MTKKSHRATNRQAPTLVGVTIACALLLAPSFAESVFGPRGPEEGALRRQLWQLPSPEPGVAMRTIIDRPPGSGPFRLVAAAGAFGRTARVPTLWIYAENDLYFDATLSRRMADAFRAAGGMVDYRLVPPFGEDGHQLIEAADGVAVWGPIVEKFLAQLK